MSITATHIAGAFRRLQQLGVELPTWLASDDALPEAMLAYAAELSADRVTPAELNLAVSAYLRRPLGHGGRRPWPDVGMLLAAVHEARVAALPTFGMVRGAVEAMVARHYSDRSKGFDASGLPESVRDIAVEACIAAGVSDRGADDPRYVYRDVEREYESRRGRA